MKFDFTIEFSSIIEAEDLLWLFVEEIFGFDEESEVIIAIGDVLKLLFAAVSGGFSWKREIEKLLKSGSFKVKSALLTVVVSVIGVGATSNPVIVKNLVKMMTEFVAKSEDLICEEDDSCRCDSVDLNEICSLLLGERCERKNEK
ncbi:hypothetical protein E3N88_25615 [Mikania micrantha]|uniref:Uncharacterized protein n=1 Tax=Mikania micrantha TaxID=192012 RepID=A0A5N6N5M5_9ASTR|nr:hypothetical protein E3N88_25615 [Mikania micrantha]